METTYFSWEHSAAVITGNEDNRTGFILPVLKEEDGWREATPNQVKDFFIDGSRISKSEFEKIFGILGHNIPDIPVIT